MVPVSPPAFPAPTPAGSRSGEAEARPGTAPGAAVAVLVFLALTAFLLGLRLAGPSNLTDNDQERPAAYALDAWRNGHWAIQYDWTGDIASKPPLYTWLSAALFAVTGRASLAALYLPCALALFGTAVLLHAVARPTLGSRAAFLAGAILLANPLAAKLVALARTDAVFTFTVTLTAVLAFRAWLRQTPPLPADPLAPDEPGRGGGALSPTAPGPRSGHALRGWLAAWLAAALATLTKGPLGVLLGFAGLGASIAERRHGVPLPLSRGHLAGAGLLLLVCGGWFLLAWLFAGEDLVRKMLGAELVQHAVGTRDSFPGLGLPVTCGYFLGRFAPWSLVTCWGLFEAVRRPVPDAAGRRLQRFAAAGLILGLVTFGLGAHQRGDLVAPLLPFGSLLAAVPLARWTGRWPTRRLIGLTLATGLLLGTAFQLQHALRPLATFPESRGLAEMAATFLERGGDPARIVHLDVPFALQFHLGTMRRAVTAAEAAAWLQQGRARYAALADPAPLRAALGTHATSLQPLLSWPADGPARFQIVEYRDTVRAAE